MSNTKPDIKDITISRLQAQLADAENTKTELEKQLAEANRKLHAAGASNGRQQQLDQERETTAKLEADLRSVQAQLEIAKQQLHSVTEQLRQQIAEADSNARAVGDSHRQQLDELQKRCDAVRDEQIAATRQADDRLRQLRDTAAELESVRRAKDVVTTNSEAFAKESLLLKKQLDEANHSKDEAARSLAELRAQLDEARMRLAVSQKAQEESSKKAQESLRTEQGETTALRAQLDEANRLKDDANRSKDEAARSLAELRAQLDEANQLKNGLQARLAVSEKEKTADELPHAELATNQTEDDETRAKLQAQLDEANRVNAELRAQCNEVNRLRTPASKSDDLLLAQEATALQAQLDEAKEARAALQAQLAAARKQSSESDALRAQVDEANQSNNKLRTQVHDFAGALREMRRHQRASNDVARRFEWQSLRLVAGDASSVEKVRVALAQLADGVDIPPHVLSFAAQQLVADGALSLQQFAACVGSNGSLFAWLESLKLLGKIDVPCTVTERTAGCVK
jgi:chromosome segregation ATPase